MKLDPDAVRDLLLEIERKHQGSFVDGPSIARTFFGDLVTWSGAVFCPAFLLRSI